jgi:hypothetical protein
VLIASKTLELEGVEEEVRRISLEMQNESRGQTKTVKRGGTKGVKKGSKSVTKKTTTVKTVTVSPEESSGPSLWSRLGDGVALAAGFAVSQRAPALFAAAAGLIYAYGEYASV